MFKILVVFFILNLLYSICKFKVLVNPATLFGLGFVIASFMCLYFYDEWVMQSFKTETFNIFIIGTLLFTGTCSLLCQKKGKYICKENIDDIPIEQLYSKRIFILISVVTILQLFVCYYKYSTAKILFGTNATFSELVYMTRLKFRDGDEIYPWWFNQIHNALLGIIPFIYLLFGVVVAKKSLTIKWIIFIIVVIFSTSFGGVLSGAKGGPIQTFFLFFLAIILKYIKINRKLNISSKYYIYVACIGFMIIFGINAMNNLLGRGDRSNTVDAAIYAGAIYCGAEFKNMDLYIKHPKPTDVWGENTFRMLYRKLDQFGIINYKEKRYESSAIKPFVYIHGLPLGNVYTIFCDLYWDFGFCGILWMPVMAIVLMIFFNKIFTSSKPVAHVSIWEYFYLTMAWHTFMSFFSNRFFEAYCNPIANIRMLIYFYFFDYIFRHWVYLPKNS